MKQLALCLATALLAAHTTADTNHTKLFNITANPAAPGLGVLLADIGFKVNDNLLIGPKVTIGTFEIDDFIFTMNNYGVFGHYSFNEALTSGIYSRLYLQKNDYQFVDNITDDCRLIANHYSVATTIGYEWHAHAGLNFMTGIGYEKVMRNDRYFDTCKSASAQPSITPMFFGLAFDINVGYAF